MQRFYKALVLSNLFYSCSFILFNFFNILTHFCKISDVIYAALKLKFGLHTCYTYEFICNCQYSLHQSNCQYCICVLQILKFVLIYWKFLKTWPIVFGQFQNNLWFHKTKLAVCQPEFFLTKKKKRRNKVALLFVKILID